MESRSRVSRTRSRLSPCDKRAGPTRFARAPRAESAGRTPLLPSRNSSETLAARRQQQASAPRASARPPDARGRGTRRTRGSRAPAPGPPGGEWSRQSLEHRGAIVGPRPPSPPLLVEIQGELLKKGGFAAKGATWNRFGTMGNFCNFFNFFLTFDLPLPPPSPPRQVTGN